MQKYKIAFIGQKGIPATYGGVERHVEELTKRLAKRGHKVVAYSRKNYNNFNGYYNGVKIINLPVIPEKHTEMISHTFLSCLELLDRKIDIVHIHSVDPAIISFLPKIKAKVVATSHGQAYRREKWGRIAKSFSKFAERFYCLFPDVRIAVSKTLKQYYETKYRRPVHYIPNGVNLPALNGFSDFRTFLINDNEIKLTKNSYLLYVGRILPTKGVDILIEAWNDLVGRKYNLDKNLVIVGGTSYTEKYVSKLKSISKDSVIWLDYRYGEELSWLYANAYCVVVPSEVEGLALTLLEAMSYGKCVIYSNIPENAEAVHGVGLSFQNKNVNDLAKKIRIALDNQNLLQELGEQARRRIKREYNWEDIVIQIENTYKSTL